MNLRYHVKRIASPAEITACERFSVDREQWTCLVRPRTSGYMGYLDGRGLLVKMFCEERNPKRVWSRHRDPVWKDSAMEVFLAAPEPSGSGGEGEAPSPQALHLSFEVNANGAVFAQYGRGKWDGQFVPDRFYEESGCRTLVEEDGWQMELLIPSWLLEEKGGISLDPGTVHSRFYCNFYKISESPEIEHYLSFSEIHSVKPDFHRPDCFAEAILEGGA